MEIKKIIILVFVTLFFSVVATTYFSVRSNLNLISEVKQRSLELEKEYYQFKNRAFINRCVDVYVDTIVGDIKYVWPDKKVTSDTKVQYEVSD